MKQSTAQARATQKWEKNNYYKVVLRIPKAEEPIIKAAAGDSINRFILEAVREKIRTQDARRDAENAGKREIRISLDAATLDELEQYGPPAVIAAEAVRAIMEEYRAGLR